MRWLLTGTAGFIGFHVARRLLQEGHEVMGLDGLTPSYDVKLKEARHALLSQFERFTAHRCMLEDVAKIGAAARAFQPEMVIHLAAQAGVRYSLEAPQAYISSNVVGSLQLLELCRSLRPRHVLLASTSSIYGEGDTFPLAESSRTDHPLSPYAASKKSMEVVAHSYAHLWGLPTTVFRFFTVYGPWGRPDMAPFKFVRNILAHKSIDIYNHGRMERDFTYVDDLVEAVVRLSARIPVLGQPVGTVLDSLSPVAPYRIVNIAGHQPTSLLDFVAHIERAVGRRAERNYLGMQAGDVTRTIASSELLEALIGYRPSTPIAVGIAEFVRWYRQYYGV